MLTLVVARVRRRVAQYIRMERPPVCRVTHRRSWEREISAMSYLSHTET